MNGKPLQIISFVDKQLVPNREQLKHVLDKCHDLPLVIYSVVGKFREGKSFLLNLFLRYNKHRLLGTDWKQDKSSIEGFRAENGLDRVTDGIWLWSEPIFTKNMNGHKVAVLLFDTQGTFDTRTTSAVNNFIFGFAVAISSVTMYNVKDRVNEQDLQNANVFSKCFQHLKLGSFQTLMLIVRDWIHLSNHPCGLTGGSNYTKELLEPRLDDQLDDTREQFRKLFKEKNGFLLPKPGDSVLEYKNITMDMIKPEFLEFVEQLCQKLFVDNLEIRSSADGLWTGDVLLSSFEKMIDAHKKGDLIDPGTFLEAHTRVIGHRTVLKSFDLYKSKMEKAIDGKRNSKEDPIDDKFLQENHDMFKNESLLFFRQTMEPFGTLKVQEEDLSNKIDQWFNQERINNGQLQEVIESKKKETEAIKQNEERRKELEQMVKERDFVTQDKLREILLEMNQQKVRSPQPIYYPSPMSVPSPSYGACGGSCQSGPTFSDHDLSNYFQNCLNLDPPKRGPGRPLGSKNKPKEVVEEVKRGPGRPLGSKNKPKEPTVAVNVNFSGSAEPKRGPGRPPGSTNTSSSSRTTSSSSVPAPVRRGPGRPPGSKNKPK